MNRHLICSVLLASVALLVGHVAGGQAQQASTLVTTQQADCTAFLCRFTVGGRQFRLAATGQLSLEAESSPTSTLRLPVSRYFEITRVFHASSEADLLIAYEIEDREVGVARVVRVRTDRARLKQVWAVEIPGFNLSEGVIEQPYLYQAAIGFVAKIDLRHGAFVWKHERLYDRARQSFGSFQRPIVGRDDIQFIDEPAAGGAPRRIVVNKHTGVMRLE